MWVGRGKEGEWEKRREGELGLICKRIIKIEIINLALIKKNKGKKVTSKLNRKANTSTLHTNLPSQEVSYKSG